MDRDFILALHSDGATHTELFRAEAGLPVRTYSRRPLRRALPESVRAVFHDDPEYPAPFARLKNRPFVLYVRWGELLSETPSLAIVGSRKLTEYGRNVTELFASHAAAHGVTAVSGWAYGADSCAHSAALDSGGRTVCFLWTGIDVAYPASNRRLFDRISSGRWTLATPFAPGTPPLRHHFPIRNALVAAYSDGTLVTEAAENSWSVITATLALEFGKATYAVPGDVFRPNSAWTNRLIRDGLAKAALSPADVLVDYGAAVLAGAGGGGERRRAADPLEDFLRDSGESDAEAICLALGTSLPETLSRLSFLEIGGRVSSFAGRYRLLAEPRQTSIFK